MAQTVKKNPTQKFQYEKGMETLSGKQFGGEHMAHLRTAADSVGVTKANQTASSAKA